MSRSRWSAFGVVGAVLTALLLTSGPAHAMWFEADQTSGESGQTSGQSVHGGPGQSLDDTTAPDTTSPHGGSADDTTTSGDGHSHDGGTNDGGTNDGGTNDGGTNDGGTNDGGKKGDGKKDGGKKDDGKKHDAGTKRPGNAPHEIGASPVPPPQVPGNLPAAIEPLSGYQGQGICDVTPKVGTDKLTQLIRDTYETTYDIWAPRDCNEGGRSEHKEYRAIDWMINSKIPAQNDQANSFLSWLLATDANGNRFAMARRLGVMYIGWNDRIWESYTQQWTELKGCYSTPQADYDTYCHRNHIHISLSWDGAAGFTSFWGGTPNPVPFCDRYGSAASDPMPVGNGLDFVPITPTRILDSRAGIGTSGGQPCRVTMSSSGGPGAPLAINVADRKDAPKGGVRAVAVRVVSLGSNSPAIIQAKTTGEAALLQTPPNARREAMTILPVASDGTIALTTNSGSTFVVVDLLGYFVKPATGVGIAGRLLPQSDEVLFDSTVAPGKPLAPGEKRILDLSEGSTSGGAPAADLLSITVTSKDKPGELVFRRTGEKRTPATTTIDYRRAAQSTSTILAPLDPDGHLTVVNNGTSSVDIKVVLQASAVRATELGSLLVPVAPAPITTARTTLTRALAKGDRARLPAAPQSVAGESDIPERRHHKKVAPAAMKALMMDGVPAVTAAGTPTALAADPASATAAIVQVSVVASGKGGSVTFWSLKQPASPSLVVSRQSMTTGLVVVPLDQAGTIHRTVSGTGLDVEASVVAYLR